MSRNFFLFNIFATLLCLSALGTACQPSGTGNPGPGDKAEAADVKALYRQHCGTCHGADGKLGLNGAGDLTQSERSIAERVEQIAKGKNLMPAFEELLTKAEIEALAGYTVTLKSND